MATGNISFDNLKKNTEEDLNYVNKQKSREGAISSGYFQAACALSGILLVASVILLGLMLQYVDECESKPSTCCPYFTNPNKNLGGKPYATHAVVDGESFPLDPDV